MFNIYIHTYKFIYMYAYILCTKRFVVIFVVIVWKTTLNTFEKLEKDYLRRLFEENHLRRIIWEESFEENHLKKKAAEEKYLIREDETEYWEDWNIKREQIDKSYWLKFLVFVSSVSIFRPVSSCQKFLPRCFSSQMILLKWSFSNDVPQMISLKWFSSNNLRK
jgi:hypothetical protein